MPQVFPSETCHSGGQKLLHVRCILRIVYLCLHLHLLLFHFLAIELPGSLPSSSPILGSLHSVCQWRWPCNFTQKHQHQVQRQPELCFPIFPSFLFRLFTRRLVYFGINVNFNLFRKYFLTQVPCGAL